MIVFIMDFFALYIFSQLGYVLKEENDYEIKKRAAIALQCQ